MSDRSILSAAELAIDAGPRGLLPHEATEGPIDTLRIRADPASASPPAVAIVMHAPGGLRAIVSIPAEEVPEWCRALAREADYALQRAEVTAQGVG